MFAIWLGVCHFLLRHFEPLKAFLDLFEANKHQHRPLETITQSDDPDCWDEYRT